MTTAVDDFLLHYGKKGMKWGIRRTTSSQSKQFLFDGSPVSKENAKIHNDVTDNLARKIKSATHEGQMNKIIDKAYDDGYGELNIKLSGAEATRNNKVKYELKLYRLTPDKANMHSEDGLKVEYLEKEVDRNPRPGKSIIDDPENFEHTFSVENFLAHYGVQGMKWGVRRKSSGGTVSSTPASGKPPWQSAPTKKLATTKVSSTMRRGKKQKVLSPDAEQIRDIRLKVKREGIQSLTNKDLEVINRRMELQQKYNKNFPKKKSPASVAADLLIDAILSNEGEKQVMQFLTPRSASAASMVKTAIGINRSIRTKK